MKKRSIGIMILLTFVTLGIYLLYWTAAFQGELKRTTGQGFDGFVHIVLIFVTFGIYYIYWSYKVGERIQAVGGRNNGILYLVLHLISVGGFLNPFLMQSEVNQITLNVIDSPQPEAV